MVVKMGILLQFQTSCATDQLGEAVAGERKQREERQQVRNNVTPKLFLLF